MMRLLVWISRRSIKVLPFIQSGTLECEQRAARAGALSVNRRFGNRGEAPTRKYWSEAGSRQPPYYSSHCESMSYKVLLTIEGSSNFCLTSLIAGTSAQAFRVSQTAYDASKRRFWD
jgi:hypothetical protein